MSSFTAARFRGWGRVALLAAVVGAWTASPTIVGPFLLRQTGGGTPGCARRPGAAPAVRGTVPSHPGRANPADRVLRPAGPAGSPRAATFNPFHDPVSTWPPIDPRPVYVPPASPEESGRAPGTPDSPDFGNGPAAQSLSGAGNLAES